MLSDNEIRHIRDLFVDSHAAIGKLGIVVSPRRVNNELRKIARRRNCGRARAVSYRRPSPQLSRRDLELARTQARLNLIAKIQQNQNTLIGEIFLPKVGV